MANTLKKIMRKRKKRKYEEDNEKEDCIIFSVALKK